MSSDDWKNGLGAEQSGAPVSEPHGEIRNECLATQIEPSWGEACHSLNAIGCTRGLGHVESQLEKSLRCGAKRCSCPRTT